MNTAETLLLNVPAVPVALWVLLSISDYYLTIWGARLYQSGPNQIIVIPGSYETVPMFRGDVDSVRYFSKRLLLVILAGSAIILAIILFPEKLDLDRGVVLFLLGAILLVAIPVHMRHISNITRFKLMINGGASGRSEYTRRYVHLVAASEFLAWAALFALFAAVGRSWFILGGSARCLVFALYQYRWISQKASVTSNPDSSSVA